MSPSEIRNLGASVRQRLFNLAKQRGDDFEILLTRYAIERLLYRLSQSPHSSEFLLKGATLFTLWGGGPYRPTRDLDLLGSGESTVQWLEHVFREICSVPVEPDGLRFAAETVEGNDIREDLEYGGVRITLVAHLEQARVQIQVDIGLGEAVTPPTAPQATRIIRSGQSTQAYKTTAKARRKCDDTYDDNDDSFETKSDKMG